jgi:hypothetical protein
MIFRWTRIFDKLDEQAAMVNVQSHVFRSDPFRVFGYIMCSGAI